METFEKETEEFFCILLVSSLMMVSDRVNYRSGGYLLSL